MRLALVSALARLSTLEPMSQVWSLEIVWWRWRRAISQRMNVSRNGLFANYGTTKNTLQVIFLVSSKSVLTHDADCVDRSNCLLNSDICVEVPS